MTEPSSRRQFTEHVARADADVDLAEASLLIACEEYPTLDVERYLRRLDEMASALSGRLPNGTGSGEAVGALNRLLFKEERFRGNTEDYYDPRNSYLNDVLDRRVGIPITLSTVYVEVARRAGLPAAGVGLPGHFIVKLSLPEGDLLVDPYHGGTLLSPGDCQKRLDRIFDGKVKLEAPMLAACGRKDILARMLRNLKAIYVKAEDYARAVRVVELLLRVNPGSGEDLRDRGILYAALDCYAFALRDLEDYLTRFPKAPESGELLEKVVELRQKAARLN